MFLSRKSLSISVHDEHQEHPELSKTQGGHLCTSLTVWRKSLIVSCKGFTVIDSDGNLVYPVDSYTGKRPKEILLIDGLGKPIFTM
ncbi:respiratory burst oxidase-like protein A-like isoform 1 [Hibiscus syriacus]|uniref:Respiratory burst oxidase-like protein A-like isoform 1 n=1 Tax=Hibiscus syriacus TaxID=106335 RepID=A0A6A2ZTU7_HIBSY|nr:respiratory burst oxidase-like protein A-like isoform 1 [Hibiscus syriacus]